MSKTKLKQEEKEKVKTYLTDCTKELYMRKSVIVLKYMSVKEAKYVFDLVRNNKSIVPRTIEYKSHPTVFLKYHNPSNDADYEKMLRQAQQEYNKGYLDESLYTYKQIVKNFPRPNSFIFYRIGLLYLKHQQRKPALLYLNLALGLSKKENRKHAEELEDLIFNVSNCIPLEEQKDTRYINMTESDFYEEKHDSKLEDIASLIKEDNLDFSDTCKKYNLTTEEVLLVKLISARNSYASKNFSRGDKFMKEVEKSHEKTEAVKELFKEITTNKKMYQYREVKTKKKNQL